MTGVDLATPKHSRAAGLEHFRGLSEPVQLTRSEVRS